MKCIHREGKRGGYTESQRDKAIERWGNEGTERGKTD
jgi:hypothetical protein